MSVSCPKCDYTTDTGQGVSVHFGLKHDGNLSNYNIDTSMTAEQRQAVSEYERPTKERLKELSNNGFTFEEIAETVDDEATRYAVSHWFDTLSLEHENQGQTASGDGKYRDEDWLQNQFDSGKTVTEIADEVGVRHNTIAKWADKFDIGYTPANRQPVGDGRYRDKEWLQKMHDEYDDQQDIAEICGTSLTTINKWAKRLDIDYESRYERQRNPDADWRMKSKWDETRFSVYERDNYTCQNCGKENCEVHAHHIEQVSNGGEKYDMDNIITWCKECHLTHHGILGGDE